MTLPSTPHRYFVVWPRPLGSGSGWHWAIGCGDVKNRWTGWNSMFHRKSILVVMLNISIYSVESVQEKWMLRSCNEHHRRWWLPNEHFAWPWCCAPILSDLHTKRALDTLAFTSFLSVQVQITLFDPLFIRIYRRPCRNERTHKIRSRFVSNVCSLSNRFVCAAAINTIRLRCQTHSSNSKKAHMAVWPYLENICTIIQ